MSDKTFAVAGWSTLRGVRKLRVARNMNRVKVLEREGHKDIELQVLPRPMTREQAREFLHSGAAIVTAAVDAAVDAAVAAATDTAEESAEEPNTAYQELQAFAAALSKIPQRDARGHFIPRAQREQMARELMAAETELVDDFEEVDDCETPL